MNKSTHVIVNNFLCHPLQIDKLFMVYSHPLLTLQALWAATAAQSVGWAGGAHP
jgi:hypothetical protein